MPTAAVAQFIPLHILLRDNQGAATFLSFIIDQTGVPKQTINVGPFPAEMALELAQAIRPVVYQYMGGSKPEAIPGKNRLQLGPVTKGDDAKKRT